MTQITEPGLYPDIKEEPVMTEETKSQDIVAAESRQVAAHSEALSPLQVINNALSAGVNSDTMRALMQMQNEYEDRKARKAYVRAMAAFKKGCPKIYKNRKVSFENRDGKKTEYTHATLDHIVETVCPVMSEFGLSHTWETEQLEGGLIRVTCIVTHEEGHSEHTTLQSGRDDSGGKNNIQAVGSAVMYLQRYTFLAATGLAAQDMDDDGAAIPSMRVTSDEAEQLTSILMDKGGVSAVNNFKAKFKVDHLGQIPAARFNDAMRAAKAMQGIPK